MDYTISQFRADIRNGKWCWPGGGELYFLCSDGGILCHDCAWKKRRSVVEAIRDHDSSGWRIVAACNSYNEEPTLRVCDHCGAEIGDQGDRYEARRSDTPGSPFWIVYDLHADVEHDPSEEEERAAGGPFPGDGWSEEQARAVVSILNE